MEQVAIVIGNIMIIVGLITTLLDMGMNGSQQAGWAPYGLIMMVIGLVLVSL